MQLTVYTTFKRLVNIAKIEDAVLETFREEVKEGVKVKSPVDTIRPRSYSPPFTSIGQFKEGWKDQSTGQHTAEVSNETPQAGFLQGTGVWGRGYPIQSHKLDQYGNRIRLGPFMWRADNDRWHHPFKVMGINPRAIARNDGPPYNFIEDMNTGIDWGVYAAMEKLDKKLEEILKED